MSHSYRSLAYAKGILSGTPSAIQVADRFHLLRSLAETIDQIFCHHAKILKEVAIEQSRSTHKLEKAIAVVLISPPAQEKKEKSKATARREKRLAIYEQIQTLKNQGLDLLCYC